MSQQGKKSWIGIFAGFAAATLALTGAALPAQAVVEDPTSATARAFLAKYGANQVTQDRLIRVYKAGGKWESMNSSNSPVSEVTRAEPHGEYTIDTYADGSISVTRAERARESSGGTSARGISGCSVSGTSRNNCKIDMWVGLVSMSFMASYNLGNNTVTNVYGAGWSIGGACGTSLNYLGRPTSNIGRMDIQAQMCLIPYSTTFWLQLTVRSGSASVSWVS